MGRRILYIVNPISGTRNKQSLQKIIEEKTQAAGFFYEIYPSVADGNYDFLDEVVKEKGFTQITVAGGDGTINAAISSLKKHGLPFGLLPCGSGNGLAFSAGIPKTFSKAMDITLTGRPQWADAFEVNNRFACMLCGLGFDAQVAHDFANDKKRGLMTYVKKIVQNFFTSTPYPFVLKMEENEMVMDAYFISIANSNQYGNNFTIAPKASLTDGMLDIVVMTRQNKLSILLQTLMQVSGLNKLQQVEMVNEQTSVVYFQTRSIGISNPSLAPLHIDGDPADSAEEINIRVLPKSFQLIFPA